MKSRGTVIAELRGRIEAGQLRPGQRVPSERQLSEDLKVSRGAIQEALKELEADGWIERQPNCRPVVSARLPSSSPPPEVPSGQVAVWMIPDVQDLGGQLLLQGIRSELASNGHYVLTGGAPSLDPKSVLRAQSMFLNAIADNPDVIGAIVWPIGFHSIDDEIKRIRAAGTPVVFVDREPKVQGEIDVVSVDHQRAARRAVQHLVDLGHRRIAMVVYEGQSSSIRDRIEAYRCVLAEAGVPWRDDFVLNLPPMEEGKTRDWPQILSHLLAQDEAPTAIFSGNDHVAFQIRAAASALSIRVPDELSIVGFDWLMRWHPSGGEITTIAQPFFEVGTEAVRVLLDRVKRKAGPGRRVLLDAPLVVKTSTSTPPVRTSTNGTTAKENALLIK